MTSPRGETAPAPRLLLSVPEAAAALAIKRTKMYELLSIGDVAVIHIGRRTLVPMSSLEEYVERRLHNEV